MSNWRIEYGPDNLPERMVWLGIDYCATEPVRCQYGYTDRAGRIYGCTLAEGHQGSAKGRHNFQLLSKGNSDGQD